jgi:NodT family efflux transporter outer membrane factor (OMF) lipoprotein
MTMRTTTRSIKSSGIALALSLLAAACTVVGTDYEQPAVDIPAAWREEAGRGLAAGATDLAQWWRRLEDPVLDELVERAVTQGLDLRAALARVREARALRGVATADRWPTVDATASYERHGESKNTQFGSFVSDSDIWSAGFDAAWELDVWGRVRRSVEAADADLAAGIEDARDVAVTVAAETAANYVQLRAFQRRLEIARTNVELQEETLALVNGRYAAGLVGERDVAQAIANVEFTRSRLPAFEVGVRAAENRLAVLLGRAPGALARELLDAKPIPVPPAEIAIGVPADLLRKRADVRRAERTLAAEHARIGVAEGDLYPRLALLGHIGVQSDDPDTLFEDASNVFGIGPSLRWNIFDGGRLRRRVEAQDARAEQAYVAWERTVLLALEESENAMTGFVREQRRRTSLLAAATQARRAVELAQTQYQEGLTDFQAVVDSERALADLEDELASSDATITTDLIALYKALGGGFEHDPIASAVAVARTE